ncbi:MAG: hypothetical protein U0894_20855 [Pirellulales bacterium]
MLSQTIDSNTDHYIHSLRGIHAQKDASNNWEWMLQDGVGSGRGVVDNASAVLWSGSYDPFGTDFGATGTSQTSYGLIGERGPCDGTAGATNCQQFFSDRPIVLGWIERQNNFHP